MKLPAFFGHKRSINLLPHDSFEGSTLGIVLEWALVFGKWAVIVTQLIVMGAFLYRFTLDRTLTDLHKAVAKDVAMIKSYDQVERDYVLAQKQIAQAKIALNSQDVTLRAINEVARITPMDVWYDRVMLTPSNVSMTAYASSLSGFGQFLTAAQNSGVFRSVRVAKIESSATAQAQMQFEVSFELASPKPGAKQ